LLSRTAQTDVFLDQAVGLILEKPFLIK
jgi:hypothetical protein